MKKALIIAGVVIASYLIYYGSRIEEISEQSVAGLVKNENSVLGSNINKPIIQNDTAGNADTITQDYEIKNNLSNADSFDAKNKITDYENISPINSGRKKNGDQTTPVKTISSEKLDISDFTLKTQTNPEETQKVQNNGSDTSGMILIPAGNFEFGENEKKKIIFLEDYYIDKFEVTNAEFKSVFPEFNYKTGDDHKPVAQITFSEALTYAKRKNKDLPTVYEWEKAAGWNPKSNKKYLYPWGNDFKKNSTIYLENSGFVLSPVNGEKYNDISFYGAVFMAGNVSEWTKTRIKEIFPDSDEKIKNDFICKGGSYFDNAEKCSVNYIYNSNGAAQTGIGFRCVKRNKSTIEKNM
ncbi:MAG TPA: SUMF1/EgtB/PvdO family nonheme iron enzyme [bacterium]|nr:SUMF1/EgtB/PvdO family nonheme iron enzyme [bacterium]